MINQRNLRQTGCPLHPHRSAVKRLTATLTKVLAFGLTPSAIVILTAHQLNAQALNPQAPQPQPPSTQPTTAQAPNAQVSNAQSPTLQSPKSQAPNAQSPNAQSPNSQSLKPRSPNLPLPKLPLPTLQSPNAQSPSAQSPNLQTPNTQPVTSQPPNSQAPNSQTPGAQVPTAQTQTCGSSYEPGMLSQRTKSGLFDGRLGQIKFINNTEMATVISLYHPDAPKRVFKYWYAEPGKSYLLGIDNYSSDWGIQVDDGPICYVGRVTSWDGRGFITFPRRLLIADVPTVIGVNTRSQTSPTASSLSQPPETYEAIATQQIKQGEPRSGLISLLRAADLYRASGRLKEEQRVRDRIEQLRDAGKSSAAKP